MKALTLTQPWATLVVRGIKTVETRSWSYNPFEFVPDSPPTSSVLTLGTYVYGLPMPLAIHAAKGQDRDAREFADYLVRSGVLDTADLPRGAIVGTVEYFDWTWSFDSSRAELAPSDLELELGDWSDGRILWRFRNPVEFAEPIPRRGQLRIWNWLAPEFVGLERAVADGIAR